MRTLGFSGKVLATVIGAVGAQALALLTSALSTGEWDGAQWAQLGGLALSAAVGALLGYLKSPDDVEFPAGLNVPGGGPAPDPAP